MKYFNTLIGLAKYFRNPVKAAYQIMNESFVESINLKNGLSFSAPSNHPLVNMIHEIFISEVYIEPGGGIGSDDLVVDIGANIGLFGIYASTKTSNKVLCFEPFPENVEFIG